jgi:hypothetical protein
METLPNCAACKGIYSGRVPPEEPPCDACRPEILEENRDALFIYSLVQSQFIMGPSGPVDINQLAVWESIDRFKIRDSTGVFKKVLHLSRWMVERISNQERGDR